jgi:hypothetical protein
MDNCVYWFATVKQSSEEVYYHLYLGDPNKIVLPYQAEAAIDHAYENNIPVICLN